MSVQENKEIIRRYWEESAQTKDLGVVDELLAEDFVDRSPPPGFGGDRESYLRALEMYYAALPDHTVTIEEMVAEGDRVATRWMVRGTHQGELMGVPPTNRVVEVEGLTINRVVDGKIIEQWEIADMATLMQQIGAMPGPET